VGVPTAAMLSILLVSRLLLKRHTVKARTIEQPVEVVVQGGERRLREMVTDKRTQG
jgi:isocitrate/isopropylmalate dehydrogenase